MPKRLTTSAIRALKLGQRKSDGDGLAIENEKGIRFCIFRYRDGPRHYREMRLGRWRDDRDAGDEGITLAEARGRVRELRGNLARGIDPKAERPVEPVHTFAEAADLFIAAKVAPVAKHQDDYTSAWRQSLKEHAKSLMTVPVDLIDVDHVLSCLEPIWLVKTPTASRIRGRIERILSYARARGWREGANPAIWRDNLEHLLAKPDDVHKTVGYASLDWRDAPAFIAKLRGVDGIPAKMLELAVLCGVRTKPVRCMRRNEIELERALWTVPAAHEKTTKLHRVPLTDRAMTILRSVLTDDMEYDDVVFCSEVLGRKAVRGRGALYRALQGMDLEVGLTVHGFRTTFRTWAKANGYARDLAEETLSHVVGDKVERAYTREEDALGLRRALMQQWVHYLNGAEVIDLPVKQVA